MAKLLIREVAPYAKLYRDDRTGIAWIEDGSSGCGISIHPNIDASGSVRGMKKLGYWDKKDRTLKSGGCIYNIDHVAFSFDTKGTPTYEMEQIVYNECKCQACMERRFQ